MSRWSKEQCERWFVQTPKASLKELETLASVPFSTLKKWQSAGKWVQRRERFQAELSEEIRSQTIEKTAAHVSDRWVQITAELTEEHVQAFQTCRRLAERRVKAIEAQIRKLQTEIDVRKTMNQTAVEVEAELEAMVSQIDLDEISACVQTIDRCVKGERMCLSMEYIDINRAIASVERAGLQVVAPSDSVLREVRHGG